MVSVVSRVVVSSVRDDIMVVVSVLGASFYIVRLECSTKKNDVGLQITPCCSTVVQVWAYYEPPMGEQTDLLPKLGAKLGCSLYAPKLITTSRQSHFTRIPASVCSNHTPKVAKAQLGCIRKQCQLF